MPSKTTTYVRTHTGGKGGTHLVEVLGDLDVLKLLQGQLDLPALLTQEEDERLAVPGVRVRCVGSGERRGEERDDRASRRRGMHEGRKPPARHDARHTTTSRRE